MSAPSSASSTQRPVRPRRIPRAAAFVAATALALAAGEALATTYYGAGDTGWSFDNKRDCCDEAVWLAQDEAAAACEAAGGRPKIRSGTSRGTCDWDARGGSFDRVYRCTARSSVDCR